MARHEGTNAHYFNEDTTKSLQFRYETEYVSIEETLQNLHCLLCHE